MEVATVGRWLQFDGFDSMRDRGKGMSREYVDKREGSYWIAETRVSLDSVVYAFLRGASPEGIADSFPVLSLEEVYGAIAFYLAHQAEMDAQLAASDREFEILRKQTRDANPNLHKKLEEARQHLQSLRK
jgi:uncharacterized protein (DUF433 family)